MAIEISKWGGIRAALDMSDLNWISVYDIAKQQLLLKTKARDSIVGYALSSDARSLLVLTNKRLEMYAVPKMRTIK